MSTIAPVSFEIPMSTTPRMRDCRFSSVSPLGSEPKTPPSTDVSAAWADSIGADTQRMPRRRASSKASVRECSELYLDGMDTPSTHSAPSASTAIAATSVESMPPDRAMTAFENPFLWR